MYEFYDRVYRIESYIKRHSLETKLDSTVKNFAISFLLLQELENNVKLGFLLFIFNQYYTLS